MFSAQRPWYFVENEASIASPTLLLYQERIEHNLRLMLTIAGGSARLRPHVKTHKLGPLVQRQVELGITHFKCSTIAEVEMTAEAGGMDILLAMPAVGANADRLATLALKFPHVSFCTLADDEENVRTIACAAQQHRVDIGVYLELDCGMGRTGIQPGPDAARIAHLIDKTPGLHFAGIHAYDGHIHDADLSARRQQCEQAFAPVTELRQQLEGEGLTVKELIAGGSPTFGIHAEHPDRMLSPGTTVLWDFGYGDKFPDLPFLPAAVLLTRVVSKPRHDRITLDLGHKAVAPENPHPRVRLEELPDANFVLQSEEHLVIEVGEQERFTIGQAFHGIPRHVCPSVSMYGEALVIDKGKVANQWPILARNRRITV